MSYILEALKRLEQKQQREGGLPTLLTPQEGSSEHKTRRPLWLYLVLAALLLNAGMVLWWIAPWKPDQQHTRAQPAVPAETGTQPATVTSTTPAEKPAAQKSVTPLVSTEKRELTPTGTPKEIAQEKASATPQPSATEKTPPGAPSSKSASIIAAGPPSSDSKARPSNTAVSSAKVVGMQDLPPSVKGSLPGLNVSMHYYSDEPRARLVRINDTTLREGDVLNPPGMRVEEITPTHILFGYQGYRFTVGIDGR